MKITRRQLRKLILKEIRVIKESKLDAMEKASLQQLAIQAKKNPKSTQGKQLKGILSGMKSKDPEKFKDAMADTIIKKGASAVGVS